MKNLFLANKVEYQPNKEDKNKGKVIIEPCWPGYGLTWGNTLRRVLLTSLPGAAVTAVRIKGVKYEFTAIDGIKEDVLEIILNLKSLNLKFLSEKEEPVKLKLSVKGEKKVTAGDIEKNSDVEIINPDLLIATITDKKTSLDMDIWVTTGYGWVASEQKTREGFDVDTIITDSVFSPIVNVSVDVENMRVGKRTDFDRIQLGIETNGAIDPLTAFLEASNLLANQFKTIVDLAGEIKEPEKKKSSSKKTTKKSSPKTAKKKDVKKKTTSKKTKKATKTASKKKPSQKKKKNK